MDLAGILVFSAAYLMSTASPGPGIAALVARVLARGTRGTPAFIAGFIFGDLVWFAIVAAGLAIVAQQLAWLFVALKYAGAAYLLWLAWKFWTAPATAVSNDAATSAEGPLRLFIAGLLITLGNPKVILFFVAILPAVLDLTHMSAFAYAEVSLLMVLILGMVLAAYTLAAAQARRAFTSPRAVRVMNRGAGVAMAGAAAAIATR